MQAADTPPLGDFPDYSSPCCSLPSTPVTSAITLLHLKSPLSMYVSTFAPLACEPFGEHLMSWAQTPPPHLTRDLNCSVPFPHRHPLNGRGLSPDISEVFSNPTFPMIMKFKNLGFRQPTLGEDCTEFVKVRGEQSKWDKIKRIRTLIKGGHEKVA